MEQRQCAEAAGQQALLALRRHGAGAVPGAGRVAQRDHPDPRQQRIRSAYAQLAQLQPAAIVQHGPGRGQRTVAVHMHAIEQVVPGHQRHPEQRQQRPRQPQQRRQRQHAQPDRPDHLQVQQLRREGEGPGEVDQGQFQHDQEQPALEQERRRRCAAMRLPRRVQPRRQAGQEHEDRRAQVRQGARHEQRRCGGFHVQRIADRMMRIERLAHVVEQHQRHHRAAQQIDRGQARGRGSSSCAGGDRSGRHRLRSFQY